MRFRLNRLSYHFKEFCFFPGFHYFDVLKLITLKQWDSKQSALRSTPWYLFWIHNIQKLLQETRTLMQMTHCPSCGKVVEKPSSVLKNQCFTIEAYNCRKCHHNFKVTKNQSMYIVWFLFGSTEITINQSRLLTVWW